MLTGAGVCGAALGVLYFPSTRPITSIFSLALLSALTKAVASDFAASGMSLIAPTRLCATRSQNDGEGLSVFFFVSAGGGRFASAMSGFYFVGCAKLAGSPPATAAPACAAASC